MRERGERREGEREEEKREGEGRREEEKRWREEEATRGECLGAGPHLSVSVSSTQTSVSPRGSFERCWEVHLTQLLNLECREAAVSAWRVGGLWCWGVSQSLGSCLGFARQGWKFWNV